MVSSRNGMGEKPWVRFYEKGVPPSLHYPKTTLPQLLHHASARHPDTPAIIFYGKRITYRDLSRLVARAARAFRHLGVKKGDRMALMLPNLPQFVIAFYGALEAGAVVVQTNPLYVERELEGQLQDSGAETIVALDLFYSPRIENVFPKTSLKRVILTSVRDYLPWFKKVLYPLKAKREGQWPTIHPAPHLFDFQDLLASARTLHTAEAAPAEIDHDDVALLQYTGGTTGIPKGVMLTHWNLMVNTLQCRHWMTGLREGGEVFLSAIPFFHVYGMSVCLNLAVMLASTMVILPKFKTEEVLKTIDRHRPTIFPGVPAMYVAINTYPGASRYRLSSVKGCISGAGPLHREVQKRFEALTGARLAEGYGLSEASPVTHCNPIFGLQKDGSIGIPFPDTDAKVVDLETGTREVPVGETGELIVKGPQVMKGYWKRPEETQAVLRDGWLSTGDMARMDEDGYFYIVDRKKDMIKTRGENVYPREVEEVLFRHPKVKEAVVVGLPEEAIGEVIKAYIVVKEGEDATTGEIIEYCRRELAPFKVPRLIEFRKELPKTLVGKVLRRLLIEEEMKKKGQRGQ